MSNSLDRDHARCFVGPGLGPYCLQRLSADDTWRQRVKGSQVESFQLRFISVPEGCFNLSKQHMLHSAAFYQGLQDFSLECVPKK